MPAAAGLGAMISKVIDLSSIDAIHIQLDASIDHDVVRYPLKLISDSKLLTVFKMISVS